MPLFTLFVLLFIPLSAFRIFNSTGSCVLFQSKCNLVNADTGVYATLTFTVVNTCTSENSSVHVVSVKRKTPVPPYIIPLCQIFHNHTGSWTSADGCEINHVTEQYVVAGGITSLGSEQWILSGVLWNGVRIPTVVVDMGDMHLRHIESKLESMKTDIMILLGVIIGITTAFILGRVFKTAVTRNTHLPPPPAPHRVRRHTANDVIAMGPQAVQDGHNSFPSYGYATAFDDDTTSCDDSLTPAFSRPASDAVSDSVLNDDDIHHTNCSSSVVHSNNIVSATATPTAPVTTTTATATPTRHNPLPAGYLHPVATPLEVTTATVSCSDTLTV
ncbi:uncharacterized protein [Littorina saxatilis]|uniref:Uncharacterized protein n=1 Tax=Littorina saxatilis TaxID=31220 RepID=A0AAN9B0A1_9CAEN